MAFTPGNPVGAYEGDPVFSGQPDATGDDFCPSRGECFGMLMGLLPPGRAWQRHDGAIERRQSVLKSILWAIAGPWYSLEKAICDARDELHCATADVDLDLWYEDFGLPDDCDPLDGDLCAKAAAAGGTSIAYYEEIAARFGFVTAMRFLKGDDATYPGVWATLHVVIDEAASPAVSGITLIGNIVVGVFRFGVPETAELACKLERMLPAHMNITYEVV